jgi:hypothetical protein
MTFLQNVILLGESRPRRHLSRPIRIKEPLGMKRTLGAIRQVCLDLPQIIR